jgi:hypothetical protein
MICSSVPGVRPWHGVVFVQQGQVIKHVVLFFDHALQTMVQDHTDFVRKGRVVADAVRDGARQDVAVTVFMLQAFAVQRGAPAEVPPSKKPRACMSPAAQARSPMR